MIIPERKIVVGNPAKIVKEMTDEMIEWKTKGTELYQQLPKELYETLIPCEPLRSIPKNRIPMQELFKTWKKTS
jgi:phenylacetic acid degradation protein/carnitine operon protein CaiE